MASAQQPNGEFHYVAGFEVQEGWPVPEGMVRFQVPAQKYAVFTHKGTAPQIAESFQAIYSHLLAERGLEPGGGGRLRILRPAFPRTAGSELAS